MLPGDKAAVTCSGGVISAAVASAFARVGRAGGADSRGAAAGRGHCDRPVPQVRHEQLADVRPCRGGLPDPSHETGGAPPRELSRRSHAPTFWCAYRPARDPVEAVIPTAELPTISAALRAQQQGGSATLRDQLASARSCR